MTRPDHPRIFVAKDTGYCFGVRDAVKMAYETAEQYGTVYMLGDIVHNERVVHDLTKAGAIVVQNLDEVPDDSPVLFRAHGTITGIWEEARRRNLNIIDATCPLVREIHKEIARVTRDGCQAIIIGDHHHDEVMGIASQVQSPIIIATPAEAERLRKMKKAAVVSQSTQMIENVQAIMNILMTKVFDLHFVNTICYPTKRNHEQIKLMASEVDVMIIIGSFSSANSKRLTQLALERNPRSYQLASADDLKADWLTGVQTIGLSAGASTPDELIDEVQDRIAQMVGQHSVEMTPSRTDDEVAVQ